MSDSYVVRPAETPATETKSAAADSRAVLEVRLQKRLLSRDHVFSLDVDFQVPGGFTILFGRSGAGKTTLLDCIAGLLTPDLGRIGIGERLLFDSTRHVNIPVAKRHIGYVFQDLALFPHLTVEQNVAYGLADLPVAERQKCVAGILRQLRIASLAKRSAKEISGGESRRVALARTLVTDPALLLLDEPLAALDTVTKGKIIDDLREWNRVHRIPILYVTHNRDEVFALGERVIVLDPGRIIAQGTPHEVMSAPQLETVAQLAGFENVFDATVESVHPERGTMVCHVEQQPELAHSTGTPLALETPLVRGGVGSKLRVGIRAGDILLATSLPQGLSARNILPGRLLSLEQRDVIVAARVQCGVELKVHLTLAARDSLHLEAGRQVWLVIKTHSCHLMR